MTSAIAKPILFSGPMVRAILDGSKTQTRRIVKPFHVAWVEKILPNFLEGKWDERPLPYGRPGDRLLPAMEIPSLGRNYCADVHGHIWSRARDGKTWRRLAGGPTSKGYLSITPAKDGAYRTRNVHALVAEAFYGPAPDRFAQVRHLNGNRQDNAPDNLDWGTLRQNRADRSAHGQGMGELHHASKLTRDDVTAIRNSLRSQRDLAAQYGVSQSVIWSVRAGQTWSDCLRPAAPNAPRWTRPITLRVTDVHVQRLRDISEQDARAEGVEDTQEWRTEHDWSICPQCGGTGLYDLQSLSGAHCDVDCTKCDTHKKRFQHLWSHINGAGSWDANPWVWSVSFSVEKSSDARAAA